MRSRSTSIYEYKKDSKYLSKKWKWTQDHKKDFTLIIKLNITQIKNMAPIFGITIQKKNYCQKRYEYKKDISDITYYNYNKKNYFA